MLVNLMLFAAFVALLYHWFIGRRATLPHGPMPLPLIGNLHQLGTDYVEIPNVLNEIGKRYGGLYTIWMPDPQVVITDYEIMKEALVGQGDAFSGRPTQYLFEVMAKGKYGLAICDGWFWREQRRFALHVLRDFGFGKNVMEQKVNVDVDRLVEYFDETVNSSGELDLEESVTAAVASIIGNLTFGHRYKLENDTKLTELRQLNLEFLEVFSGTVTQLLNSYPWLRFVPLFDNFNQKKVDRMIVPFVKFFEDQIRAHKTALDQAPDQEPADYTAAYLQEIKKREGAGEPLSSFTEWQLICAVADLWGAGMDTTVTTLRWGILHLCLKPEIQERAHAELKQQFPDAHHRLTMADRNKLPYIMACLHEIQRCGNIVPINLQHRTTQDVVIRGIKIPKDTTVLPQLGSVLNDETIFAEPKEFKPERFLDESGRGLNQQLVDKVIPFSMGKRQCLGEALARMELFLFFATFIQKFKFKLAPKDAERSKEDLLKPMFGLVSHPKNYSVIIEKR